MPRTVLTKRSQIIEHLRGFYILAYGGTKPIEGEIASRRSLGFARDDKNEEHEITKRSQIMPVNVQLPFLLKVLEPKSREQSHHAN